MKQLIKNMISMAKTTYRLIYNKIFRSKYVYYGTIKKILKDDIFLVSHPRSGNKWLCYLLANLYFPEKEINVLNINDIIPNIYIEVNDNPLNGDRRIIKSHSPYNRKYNKVIYLIRDPRAVARSYYDYMLKNEACNCDFDQYLLKLFRGDYQFGSWQKHVQSWNKKKNNILLVKYEDLVKDTEKQIRLIGKFIDKEWSREQIRKAIEKCTYENQKKDFQLNRKKNIHAKHYVEGIGQGIDGWKGKLTEEQIALINKYAGKAMRAYGYLE